MQKYEISLKITLYNTKKHQVHSEPVLFYKFESELFSLGLINTSNHAHGTTESDIIT